jgi:3-methyladenine DNA glycosylase AlkD
VSLLLDIRRALQGAADSSRAPAMQAYMKSTMPYCGVPVPLVRQICRTVFAGLQFSTAQQWQTQVLSMWRDARFREERYAVINLTGHRSCASFQTPAAMGMYEQMIVSGAWWDYVDEIASHRVGPILRSHPGPMRRKMRSWSRSNDLWKRRTAILCQLGFKEATDVELLYACIEPSLGSREFFLQKAIGWALRQYARTDGPEIRRYVRLNRDRLSALSCREALKHL